MLGVGGLLHQALGSQMKILVIDDNHDAADMLAAMLEMKGHETLAAYGPREGLATIKVFYPDVVFLDIGMPDMDGYQVAANIRKDPTLRQPFIVAFSAWGDAASVERAREAGFDCHLTKTCTIESVVAAIDGIAV